MSTFENVVSGKGAFDRVKCADGTVLSVQASRYHYCTPHRDHGPYTAVEVGFPTMAPPDSWASYFDGAWGEDDPTESVYGYVPVAMVKEFIELHGGES